jgi:hypothetical protein
LKLRIASPLERIVCNSGFTVQAGLLRLQGDILNGAEYLYGTTRTALTNYPNVEVSAGCSRDRGFQLKLLRVPGNQLTYRSAEASMICWLNER